MLVRAAKCFPCIPRGSRRWVRTYLLCQFASGITPPINLDITAASDAGHSILTWSQSSTPDTNQIWVSRNGAAFVFVASVAGSVTTYTDTSGMVNGDQWYYQVRAVKGAQASVFSQQAGIFCNFSRNAAPDTTFSFPDLVISIQNFIIQNCANLTSVSVPRLHTALGGSGFLFDNSVLTTQVNASALTYADRLTCSDGLLTILNFPVLVSVGAGGLDLSVTHHATSIVLTAFKTCGGTLLLNDIPLTTSMSLPALQTIAGNFNFDGNPNLTSISLPALISVTGNFTGDANTSLTSLPLPSFASLVGDILMTGCTILGSVSIPNLIFADGHTVDFRNCALNAASINQILARGVASATTTSDYELTGGTNAAPSGQGVADKATLIGLGNTVNTN